MAIFGLISASAANPTTDRFVSLSVGTTLVLKACGFIEDHQARILEVSETSLRVRTGQEWYERFLLGSGKKKPLEISLAIHPLDKADEPESHRYTRPCSSYCTIDVSIRPASLSWSQAEFEQESKRMLWALRAYFMAC